MSEIVWIDEFQLEVQGERFVASALRLGAHAENFLIIKPPELVRKHLTLLDAEQPKRIVELGIKDGGSTALVALYAQPDILLAADLEPEIPSILARLIETHDLHDRLITAFGLDQGDRPALTQFLDAHIPEGGIDLVVDDASHILGPTRTSFEVLFPRLRPGGLYLIEDWSAECIAATHLARVLPDAPDFADRLATVNRVLHVLNNPADDMPPGFVESLLSAAASLPDLDPDAGESDLFLRIVEAASHIDETTLDSSPIVQNRPLCDFGVELMMLAATHPEVVAEVRMDGAWLTARRGPAELPRDAFRLDEEWSDFFGYLS